MRFSGCQLERRELEMAETINANSASSYCASQDDRTKGGAAEGNASTYRPLPPASAIRIAARRPLRTDRGCHDARVTLESPCGGQFSFCVPVYMW